MRARDAILARPWWVYAVLTFNPSNFPNKWAAYAAAGKCWDDHLRESLRRKGGKIGYLQTIEAHRSRWPHVNLLMSGPELQAWVEGMGVQRRLHRSPISDRERQCLLPRAWRQWFRAAAMRAGFGPVCWVEIVSPDNADAMAGYLLKLARELTGGVAGAKAEQAPIDAPKGFRRIRASRGMLPPSTLRGTGDGPLTGALQLWRCVDAPSPAREPGERAQVKAADWASVFAALENDARRKAERWAAQAAERRADLEQPEERWPIADAPLELDSPAS